MPLQGFSLSEAVTDSHLADQSVLEALRLGIPMQRLMPRSRGRRGAASAFAAGPAGGGVGDRAGLWARDSVRDVLRTWSTGCGRVIREPWRPGTPR